jgi:hypothetical protein
VRTWSLRLLAVSTVAAAAAGWAVAGASSAPAAAASAVVPAVAVATPTPVDSSDNGQPLFRFEGKRLTQASGVAVGTSNDLFYINQDASSTNDLFTVDLTGRVRAIVHVAAPNVDWEDIALRPEEGARGTLYVADTGDAFFANREKGLPARTQYAIVKLDVPPVGRPGSTVTETATGVVRYPFMFADKATHNCESLLVHPRTGQVFVADKTESAKDAAYLWAGPARMSADSTNTFEKVGQLPMVGASGGAFSPEGDRFVIRNGTTAYVWRVTGTDMASALTRRPVAVPLPPQGQGEGVAFTPDGRSLVLASEGVNSLVWQVDLPAEAQLTAEEDDDTTFSSTHLAQDRKLDERALTVSALTLAGLVIVLAGRWVRRRTLS